MVGIGWRAGLCIMQVAFLHCSDRCALTTSALPSPHLCLPCSYYCFRVFEDRVGVCLQPPPNCGQQNARCCPPGIYGPPGSPRNVTGFSCAGKDIKCAGWGGMPGERGAGHGRRQMSSSSGGGLAGLDATAGRLAAAAQPLLLLHASCSIIKQVPGCVRFGLVRPTAACPAKSAASIRITSEHIFTTCMQACVVGSFLMGAMRSDGLRAAWMNRHCQRSTCHRMAVFRCALRLSSAGPKALPLLQLDGLIRAAPSV